LYISTSTRQDVTYSINYLSHFQNCFYKNHFKYTLRVLKYLYYTRNLKSTYERNVYTKIIYCFVDADWADDKVNRKSTTEYVIRVYESVIY